MDATPPPAVISKRVLTLLGGKVFRVSEAQIEGMQHLLQRVQGLNTEECKGFAERLKLTSFSLDTAGRAKLARLATILTVNPKVVNPNLTPANQAPYFQLLHDHISVFALGL